MIPGFDWWLLVLGLLLGGGLTWLLGADYRRAEEDLAADERALEAERLAALASGPAAGIGADGVAEILALHRAYIAGAPVDLDALDDEARSGNASA